MDETRFAHLTRSLVSVVSRRRLLAGLTGGLVAGVSVAVPREQTLAKKSKKPKQITICVNGQTQKTKKKGFQTRFPGATQGACTTPPPPGAAVVASSCVGAGDGAVRFNTLGQPFGAQRGGRLDRAEVTALAGPGGQYAIEIRDLNQGQGISSAPALASAPVTIPVIAQGSRQVVTAQFTTNATLTAANQYALVVRFLGAGETQQDFQTAPVAGCPGPGLLLYIPSGQTTFTPVPGERKLEHTVYVVP
jgi:hypothetical protein